MDIQLPETLAVQEFRLQSMLKLKSTLSQELRALHKRIKQEAEKHPEVCRVMAVPGFGPITAAAFIGEIGSYELYPSAAQIIADVLKCLGCRPATLMAANGFSHFASAGRHAKSTPPFAAAYGRSVLLRHLIKNNLDKVRLSSLFIFLLNLRPRIPQRHGAVENGTSRRRIFRVNAEIALPLKLIKIARRGARETRFEAR